MTIRPGIELAGASDVGCQRENNEDQFAYWEPSGDDEFAQKGRLAIVADGMGGYEGGQEASRIAVEAIQDTYSSTPNRDLQALLIAGFREAHQRIQQHATIHPELQGMGTTATAIALRGDQLYFAHVGDSRLYLVRDGSITRLTHDHSYVGRLVENGLIHSDEAEYHPQRHILTAALGAGADVVPDVPTEALKMNPKDILILCTDGLWGLIREEELRTIVSAHDPEEACRDLIELARKRGGPDNITLQVLRFS